MLLLWFILYFYRAEYLMINIFIVSKVLNIL